MSIYLYIDTTNELKLGLLSENLQWIDFLETQNRKTSDSLHERTYELLKNHNCKMSEIKALFTCSGPGSYTGMRVSEGLAKTLENESIDVFSFYHFEVPRLCGKNSYVWIENAFKKEYFSYIWNDGKEHKEIFAHSDLQEFYVQYQKSNLEIFTCNNLDNLSTSSIFELVKNNSQNFFKMLLIQKLRRSPYYFRDIEEEFKPSIK